jgi:antitoxin component YwqK of YwqJK toxin-antitoxin module
MKRALIPLLVLVSTVVYAQEYIIGKNAFWENDIVIDSSGKPITGVAKEYYKSGELEVEINYKNAAAVSGYCYNADGSKYPLTNANIDDLNNGLGVSCQ